LPARCLGDDRTGDRRRRRRGDVVSESGLAALIVPAERRSADRESAVAVDDKLELKVWLRLLTCANLIEGQVRNRLRENFATTLPDCSSCSASSSGRRD